TVQLRGRRDHEPPAPQAAQGRERERADPRDGRRRRRKGGALMSALLDIEDLVVEYVSDERSVRGADRVSFSIATGEILGLAGESGCGKSTVANAIMRLLKDPARISGGSIRFDGSDVLQMSADELRSWRWRETAMVFQSAMNSLNPVMRIADQIIDVLRTHNSMSRAAARAEAVRLMELVRIDPDRLKAYPHQLSGGQRQRVVI